MGVITLEYIVSYSSQDPVCKVENLLLNSGSEKPWLCSPLDKSGRLEAEFQINKASYIDFIDIGNCGSSIVEIQVSRSSFQNGTKYTSFLPAVTLLSLADIKRGGDLKGVFMFNKTSMNKLAAGEKWDRIKVICCQPYKKQCQFGLSFLSLRSKESHSQINIHHQPMLTEKNDRPFSKNLPNSGEPRSPNFPDLMDFLLTRGKQLLNASKSQNLTVIRKKKKAESLSRFQVDTEIFLIACTDENMEDKSCEDYVNEFEEQRQQKLNSSEKLIFKSKYLEIFDKRHISMCNQNDSHLSTEVNCLGKTTSSFIPDINKFISTPNEQSLPFKKRKDARLYLPSTSKSSTFNIEIEFPVKRKCNDSNDKGEAKKIKLSTGISAPTKLNYSRPEDFIQFDGIQPSTSRGFNLVDCPLCSDSFHPSEIEKHAATCGELFYT